jgi:hypothetical protein
MRSVRVMTVLLRLIFFVAEVGLTVDFTAAFFTADALNGFFAVLAIFAVLAVFTALTVFTVLAVLAAFAFFAAADFFAASAAADFTVLLFGFFFRLLYT